MPSRPSLVAAVAICLLTGLTAASAQAQTTRKSAPGKVSPQLLQQFDTNGNRKLDPDEQQAASKYLQQMQQQIQAAGGQGAGGPGAGGRPGAGRGPGGAMRPGGPMGAGGPGGGQGMGMMSPQMQQQLLQKFDANGNGQLDPNEQQAAMQYVQQMRQMQGGGGQGMGGRQGPGGPMGAGGPGGGQGMGMMSPQMQQQLLQKFDANGNGQLDPNEQQAAMQYVQQMRGAGGQGGGMRPGAGRGPGGAGRPGAGGPGGQAGAMNPQMQQQLLQNFDANGNGVLDPNEQQAATQYVQQMQQQLQAAAGGAAGTGAANKK
jgi:hypothetical protein